MNSDCKNQVTETARAATSEAVVIVPVYNEERHLEGLLGRLQEVYSGDVLFIDDGSQDCSPCVLGNLESDTVHVIRNGINRGYGATLIHGFEEAYSRGYKYAVTMDSDGQHKPEWIPDFLEEVKEWDIVTGSRYLVEEIGNGTAPADRRAINRRITKVLNERFGFGITDAFCGFKAYKIEALHQLALTETGYAMPLQFWVQVAALGLNVKELPVSRIYDDPNRRFGGGLDDPEVRYKYYMDVINREFKKSFGRVKMACTGC